jgi:hypothetical protein
MQCSDREAQFKEFKRQCGALCRAARPALAAARLAREEEQPLEALDRGAVPATAAVRPLGGAQSILDLASGGADAASEQRAAVGTPPPPALPIVDEVGRRATRRRFDSAFLDSAFRDLLRALADEISGLYRTFPLLCSRDPKLFADSDICRDDATTRSIGEDGGGGDDGVEANSTKTSADAMTTMSDDKETAADNKKNEKKKKRKKKKKPPLPTWKRELLERRGMRKVESVDGIGAGAAVGAGAGAGVGVGAETGAGGAGDGAANTCRRTLALTFNRESGSVRWGLSGQLKKQRVHRAIWGKSLIKGRPRGTCAEFHVVNEALLAEEVTTDLVLFVADLITAAVKPRCRNCLYISRDATCLSDALVFDGDVGKQTKFSYKVEKKSVRR